MGVRRNFSREWQRHHFAYSFQVADDAMQMDTHKTLYPFYTVKKIDKIPHESVRSICILFQIVFSWMCIGNEFAKRVYFLSFVKAFSELAYDSI